MLSYILTEQASRAPEWRRYLDHATTSAPKAPGVAERVALVLSELCATPGRSSHRMARASADLVERSRSAIAEFFGCDQPRQVIFTAGATAALNLALKGVLRPGDHVVATCFDHNAVLRPLARLRRIGVKVSTVSRPWPDRDLADAVIRELRPHTRLVVINHASNVFGCVLPCSEIIAAARTVGALIMLDTAQTAGQLPIDLRDTPVDLLVFSGHKGLLGPPGVGGLIVANPEAMPTPLIDGGTGAYSDRLDAPDVLPVSFEAGTPNTPAIAALEPALQFLAGPTYPTYRDAALDAYRRCVEILSALPGITVYTRAGTRSVPIISVTLRDMPTERVAAILDRQFDIQVRAGLHCAPLAHRAVGTPPGGTVRVSFGYGTDASSASLLGEALTAILRKEVT